MNVNEELLNRRIDPYLTADRLGRVGESALGRPVRVVEAKVLTGGCWNRVISVSFADDAPELVYKINPGENNAGIAREHAVLRVFARTGLPVPRPYHLDTSGSVIPGTLLVMSLVPGVVMHRCFGMLGGEDRARVSGQIGDYLGRLHETRSRGFGGVELSDEERLPVWADFWLPRFDVVFEDICAKNLVDPSLLERVVAVRELFRKPLDIGSESTLTHYDVWSGNVMVDSGEDGARVSGFIDIPGHWADYARELSFAEMFGVADSIFYEAYLSHRDLDDGFELRKNIYNLKMHLKHITMYPDELYYREGAESCLRFIERSLRA